jgi:16S rRNA (uracil1498-N3)-methyltransferase
MAVHDLTSQRLYIDVALAAGAVVTCSSDHAHYLRNVLRIANGTAVLVFNGRDGEWRARAQHEGKRGLILRDLEQARAQSGGPDVDYLFAPLKRSRLDYMVQKATEMGVRRLAPVITQHTIAERVNVERMRANVVEAAEQCGVLRLPEVVQPARLDQALTTWDPARRLVFCDESAPNQNAIAVLAALGAGPLAVLVGPEGGFSEDERALLLAKPYVTAISLGPRIMRADTAAVAALALVNAVIGEGGSGV